jgi:multidrug efflux pump subunit AcrB
MTSAAMIAGMVPAALPGLDGAAFRQPLALTVIAGVAVSTFLSLLLVPALSLSAHRLGTRLGAIAATLGKDRAPAAATD